MLPAIGVILAKKENYVRIILFFIMLSTSMLTGIWPAVAEEQSSTEESAAVKTYKKFANAFIYGRFAEARSLAEGDASVVVDRKEKLVAQGEKIVGIEEPMFMMVGEWVSPSGDKVSLNAVQVVQPNTEELMFKPPDLHRQDILLIRRGSGWKVMFFKDNLEKCCL
jgi:hypothetical protein